MYRRLLRLDAASTDFWFGDNVFEEVPGLLAHAGQKRLPELLALLQDPQLLLMHRLVVSDAVARLAREQPELRPAISAFLQQYLRHIIAHADQAAQLFPTDAGAYGYELDSYLGGLLADVQDAGLRELEPEIRELHRLGLVDESISGGADDIDFHESQPLLPTPDIFTRYQQLREDPDNYSPFHPDATAIAERRAQEEARYAQLRREHAARLQPRQVLPKIGRNDPCPCSSGKKYKKCHGA
ncbi:YecA family protein [Hymenobacter sp. BRD67]|uniref:YecA family protein n=1 Tax=Hymenobacter sp. BRD67 TaxID=2675877 RepID=UPI001C268D3B|nr:SEC-C metal-binding domain-containing protein [Hymenobacter sp. BRD67]